MWAGRAGDAHLHLELANELKTTSTVSAASILQCFERVKTG